MFKRECIHLIGVSQTDGIELTEIAVCNAFPEGIPADIGYGDNKHLEPIKNQDNEIIYERR